MRSTSKGGTQLHRWQLRPHEIDVRRRHHHDQPIDGAATVKDPQGAGENRHAGQRTVLLGDGSGQPGPPAPRDNDGVNHVCAELNEARRKPRTCVVARPADEPRFTSGI